MKFPAINTQELTGLEKICSGVRVVDYWAWAHFSCSIGSSDECARQSDVYVFCTHKHTQQESLNILDLEQWTFFVLSTAVLNAEVGRQKTITLNRLKSLGAVETDYYGLRATVIQAAKHNKE